MECWLASGVHLFLPQSTPNAPLDSGFRCQWVRSCYSQIKPEMSPWGAGTSSGLESSVSQGWRGKFQGLWLVCEDFGVRAVAAGAASWPAHCSPAVLVSFSCCAKHHDQDQLRREVRAGASAETMEDCCSWLTPILMLSSFMYHLGLPAQGTIPPQ